MAEIKILTKDEGSQDEYFGDYRQGITRTFRKFISQEKDNGEPKWEILIALEHPELEQKEKIDVNVRVGNRQFEKGYCYEISFVDSEDLKKKPLPGGKVEERKRIFISNSNITIKDNSYEKILKELKSESNLMKEEEGIWKGFVEWFRKELTGISDRNSPKYQEGRKFVEELETEFNKKTGKGNKDDERERETKKLRNCGERLPS